MQAGLTDGLANYFRGPETQEIRHGNHVTALRPRHWGCGVYGTGGGRRPRETGAHGVETYRLRSREAITAPDPKPALSTVHRGWCP